jgi:hypothetical protein
MHIDNHDVLSCLLFLVSQKSAADLQACADTICIFGEGGRLLAMRDEEDVAGNGAFWSVGEAGFVLDTSRPPVHQKRF